MSKAAAPPTTSSGSTKGHQRLDVIAEAIKVKVGRCLCKSEGDRRGSNPQPSEPQSADSRFQVLLNVAESAYLSLFLCWWFPDVSGCSVLSGVSSGVNRSQPRKLH
jgi:hypothetical protein